MEAEKIIERQNQEAFKRGAMSFEDYNYGIYNKYILIDPNMNEDDQEIFPGQMKG
jgi:hypothetical protein